MRSAIWCGRNDTLDSKDVNLLREIFLVGEMSKFSTVGWDSPPSPVFPINVWGDNGV